jgi:hypothetical protein
MSETVSPKLHALHTAAVSAFSHAGKALTLDRPLSCQIMEPQGLRIFFHWPPAIEAAVSTGAEGAVLGSLTSGRVEDSPWTTVSRVGLLFADTRAAQVASAILAEWLVDSLIDAATVEDVESIDPPRLGDEVLWSLTGLMTREGGAAIHRADVGWRRGRTVACVVAFADRPPFEICFACAADMDAQIALS